MGININCTHNDQGAWCKNLEVKRSLFGLGARCCVEYPFSKTVCPLKNQHARPKLPVAQVPSKILETV